MYWGRGKGSGENARPPAARRPVRPRLEAPIVSRDCGVVANGQTTRALINLFASPGTAKNCKRSHCAGFPDDSVVLVNHTNTKFKNNYSSFPRDEEEEERSEDATANATTPNNTHSPAAAAARSRRFAEL